MEAHLAKDVERTPMKPPERGLMCDCKKIFLAAVTLLASMVVSACQQSPSAPSAISDAAPHRTTFSTNNDLVIDASAARMDDGRVVISGITNLPDGLKMWVDVEEGKLPLGAPKSIASDESVVVQNGKFSTQPLWMAVPNTQFTKKGWPKGVIVDVRERPFLPKPYKVHFLAYFNGAWQSKDVINAVGGEGAKPLKGKIIKAENPDVIDSSKTVDYTPTLAFPALSPGAKAISLVRQTIMTVPDEGRSTGDIQAVVDMYMVSPGLKVAKGWGARQTGASSFDVSFDFINGEQGEQQATWQADLASGRVKYINENGKLFSWAPSY